MKIFIGCDHGGIELKNEIFEHLKAQNYDITDLGVYTGESIDYPDKAIEVCKKVLAEAEADARGIIICGTGIGVSIAANKIKGIRAALLADCYSARMAREHNNANVITLGGRTTGPELGKAIVDHYLNSEFAGGRHARRVDKLDRIMK